jgi:hypothetical protein
VGRAPVRCVQTLGSRVSVSSIRPLERGDLPHVARLYELQLGSGSRISRPHVGQFIERIAMDHPWADPELPSLVHVEADGRITGFVASQVRRMRFDGDPIRMVCVSHLAADPDSRSPIGALLLFRLFEGPQELTMTDTATETVRAIWERLGAETVYANCVHWRRLYRPWAFTARRLSERRGRTSAPSGAARTAYTALDKVTASLARGLLRAERPNSGIEPLTPSALQEQLPSVAAGLRLVPDWDSEFLEWLFGQLAGKGGRELGAWMVTDGGRGIGWFVYQLERGSTCLVLEVAAERNREELVLDHLFHQAQAEGAAAVEGRVEPRLLEPLSRRRCIFRYGVAMMVRSGNLEILHAIESGRALLSPLEGEWVGVAI